MAENCQNETVADPFSRRCLERCPSNPMYFVMPDTNLCGPECFDGLFADNTTNECVESCPSPYYGVNSITYFVCVQYCPPDEYMYDNERNDLDRIKGLEANTANGDSDNNNNNSNNNNGGNADAPATSSTLHRSPVTVADVNDLCVSGDAGASTLDALCPSKGLVSSATSTQGPQSSNSSSSNSARAWS